MLCVRRLIFISSRYYSASVSKKIINEKIFETDSFTNVSDHLLSHLNRKLYKEKEHPLSFIKERVVNFFYKRFVTRRGNAVFSVYDDLNSLVTPEQNFDLLLVPPDHPSRAKSDCYYINKDWMLRSHMTAHQNELLRMGLNNFLMVGDVFRKDKIDFTHYPVFHQLDGVRLFTPEELFLEKDDGIVELSIVENKKVERTNEKQEVYTLTASKMVEKELKETLEDLTKDLFGDVKYKWVESVFPFTHPSWELEIFFNDQWVEVLGCGVIEHGILHKAGCSNRIGWAFGVGLERLAMLYYSIPDIRIFWSRDPGFLIQFEGKNCFDKIVYKSLSKFPSCLFDISFWLSAPLEPNDLYEWIRTGWGDIVEHVKLIDSYKCKKTGKESHCYRITYRSMNKTLTKAEIAPIHEELTKRLIDNFKVQVR